MAKAEAKFEKEKERATGLEKQFKKAIGERELLESKLKQFHEALEGVETKIQVKNSEIGSLTASNAKLQRQVEELRQMLAKQKKQEEKEQADWLAKQRDRDAEIEVLKEMIKGVKVQLKCK